ncbi:GerMN domain-containing protein [Phormidium sp. FACHB-592]|uniref:GerMN domain-containing protein n=1 Tax=Stenomitos frigidus AS-A4 TaxID=2933935 RepID=A0ABV0KF34_9CYAN|nr:GerMN domain-containing protein [Phormidium sp. FACHB-592]MBD2076456.1 GerMN domain-containing protein [Phormidium sp. FACHB-592]
MEDQRSRRHLPLGIIAGLSALVLATGSAVAWWEFQSASRKAPAPDVIENSQVPSEQQKALPAVVAPNTASKPPVSKVAPASETKTLQVYWLKASGSTIAFSPSPVTLSAQETPNDILAAAVNKLLAGPSSASVTTTIPRDTKLRSLYIKDDEIHVDLSQAFTQGGGSTSMTARVGQILYTATSLNPDARVRLAVEGKPLETLGGEGLILEQPLTRESFERDFPLGE